MLIEDETRLKAWISHIVEDISDAEPDALAKYVIALVKKPLSDADLEKLCSDKLSVFLQAHTESFVSQLFKTLKSGQYLTKKFGSPTQETAKAAVKQPSEAAEEEKAAVHTEELVLTDGESDHEHEEHEKEEPSPQKATKETVESSAKPKSESSAPRSAITAKADSSSRQRPKVNAASPPIAQPSKPPRKRISPPPRSNSAERRRSSPRRRVIMTGGSMRVSSTRLGAERAERERHYRGGGGRPGGGIARSKSRSPPRKDKRTADIAAEMRVSSSSSSSRRHRCRDFHEKGYCMRGDNCQFDHGPDPVVVENSALKDIVRDAALFDAPTSYGVNPPPPGLESPITTSSFGVGKTLGGVTTEGYNPEAPSMDSPSAATMPHIDFSVPPPPLPQQLIQQRSAALGHQMLYAPGTGGPPPTSIMPAFSTAPTVLQIRPIQDQLPAVSAPPSALTTSTQMSGTFGGGTQQPGGGMAMRGGRFKPYNVMAARNPASRSLLVKKIPPEQNKITQLDQHFGKFGQITNIQVQYEGRTDSALVTFKTRRDAMMAYRSTEPIFNNRFIKVFWQNDVNATAAEGEGAEGGGPTIPLVGSSADTRPSQPMKLPIKLPIQYPRYFSKVFAQQKKETEETAEDEKKENAGEADQSEEKKTPPMAEMPVVTSSSAPNLHPPVIAPPPRPATYNSRVAAMKRRIADKEGMAKMVEVRKMKMNVYGKVVEQQRVMLLKLQQTEDPAQKRKIMELLKKIEANSKVLKDELEELNTKISEMQVRHAGGKKPKLGMLAAGRGAQVANGSSVAGEGNGATAEHHSPIKSPDKKLLKLCRVVYVSDCPAELNEKLIVHMERFGELFDYDINATPRTFTYKEPLDAQKAVNEAAGSFGLAKLRVEWAPVAKGVKSANDVVPDVDRKPSERVEAKDLLASLDYDEEEEEEEKKNEEEEEKGEESDDEAEDDDDEEEEDEKAERRRR